MSVIILAIESSCDDTSAAVVKDGVVLSNVMASQDVHKKYGGVIPELASRAHQQNILPVASKALKDAGVLLQDVDGIAFTRGPGLLGSLLVGTSFAKGLAISANKPLIDVNHLQGHLLSHFIDEPGKVNLHPSFPYLTLLVSGGHTQIVRVDNYMEYKIIGETIDDAAGEAFDKCAKLLDLGYPGGPVIDKLAKTGDPDKFRFSKPKIKDLNYSFSGVKTSLLYFLRDSIKQDPGFVKNNLSDLCSSFQKTIIEILLEKLIKASNETNIRTITLGGGVSANSSLRDRITTEGEKRGWMVFLPEVKYTTDNAAMIALAGYFKFLSKQFTQLDVVPISRSENYK
ncbi:MAG: tRNA (adenosine(37)-N6)-threonylcarbamoyltransferase complex transferase subunit TsaD [Bacteroidales bacterium]